MVAEDDQFVLPGQSNLLIKLIAAENMLFVLCIDIADQNSIITRISPELSRFGKDSPDECSHGSPRRRKLLKVFSGFFDINFLAVE